MAKTNLQQQITVHALPSKVWRVLTHPQYVKQYFSQDDIQCKWIDGSSILATGEARDAPRPIGKVLEAVPGISLKFTMREEVESADVTTSFELTIAGDGVELKMKCEGFNATTAEYLVRVQQAQLVLQKIKWLSEYS